MQFYMAVLFQFIKRHMKMTRKHHVLSLYHVVQVYEKGTFFSKRYTKGVQFLSKWNIKGYGVRARGGASPYKLFLVPLPPPPDRFSTAL